MFKILLLDPDYYSQSAIDLLSKIASVDKLKLKKRGLLNIIDKYDAIILRFSFKIDRKLILKAKNLKAIVTNTTGTNHIDLDSAREKGIEVICLKNDFKFLEKISSTAELTWGLIISLLRNLPQALIHTSSISWNRNKFVGYDLKGRNLGILGYGRIGRMISNYGHVFGMKVKFFDERIINSKYETKRVKTINELFKWSDILSIHLPFNESTEGLVDANLINLMKPSSYLINTSRGEIINEDDLLNALENKIISGAALDVLSNEHDNSFLKDNKLLIYSKNNNNLIISPHIGGASYDSWSKTEFHVCKKLFNFLKKL